MKNEIQRTILISKLLETCQIYGLNDYPNKLGKEAVLVAIEEVKRMITELE